MDISDISSMSSAAIKELRIKCYRILKKKHRDSVINKKRQKTRSFHQTLEKVGANVEIFKKSKNKIKRAKAIADLVGTQKFYDLQLQNIKASDHTKDEVFLVRYWTNNELKFETFVSSAEFLNWISQMTVESPDFKLDKVTLNGKEVPFIKWIKK